MPEYTRSRPRTMAERIYRLLLRLYPADFREEYGDAMVEFFRDRRQRDRDGTDRVPAGVWLPALADLARQAPAARLDAVRRSAAARRRRCDDTRNAPSLQPSRREEWMLSSMLQDARYALRAIRRSPVFAATILATLALGQGANVAIFSVVNGVLLRPLPYENAKAIVRLEHRSPYQSVSEPEFVDYRRDARSLEGLAAFRMPTVTLTGDRSDPERVVGAVVSEEFFRILGMRPLHGRVFTPDEDKRNGPSVVIIGEGLWRRRYGADSALVGKSIELNGRPRTVVGIMPARFAFPAPDVVLWAPLRLNYDTLWTRNNHYLQLIGRLAPGVSTSRASLDVSELARRFTRDFPETYAPGQPLIATVTALPDALVSRTRPYLLALVGAVAFVLLIACVNVANLLLARGELRRKEVAIRTALGASHARVVRQALTESLLYALGGGALGLMLAVGGVQLLRALAPADVPRLDEVRLDAVVFSFAFAISLLAGAVFGLVPAVRSSADDSADTLKEGGKTSSTHARGHRRTRRVLVGAEVALAVVTLSGAGLMLRSLWNLQAIDLGFRPDHVLSLRITPPAQTYVDAKATQFWSDLISRVASLPDVEAVSAVEDLPVADGSSFWSILVNGAPMTSVANAPGAMPQKIAPDYFAVMRIPILVGRGFTTADRADAPLVAVINETMARKYWPGKDAIGGTIKMLNQDAPWATVVGVVRDVRSSGFQGQVPPTMYFPQAQAGRSAYYVPSMMSLVTRTKGDPRALTGAVRRMVRELEAAAPVSRVQTMDHLVAESVASRRFATQLLVAFGVVALLLAGIGIYGVISYTVSQRTWEIGLRMALGANRGSVLAGVIGEGVRTTLIGAAVGLFGGVALMRGLGTLFVGVTAFDPVTMALVSAAIVAVAVVASYVPARRASAVDPIGALRAE